MKVTKKRKGNTASLLKCSFIILFTILLAGCAELKRQVREEVESRAQQMPESIISQIREQKKLETPVPEPRKLPSGEVILFADDFSEYDLGKPPKPWWDVLIASAIGTAFVTEDAQEDGKVGKVLEAKFGTFEEDQDQIIAGSFEWDDYVFQVSAKQLGSGYDVPSVIFRHSGNKYYLLEIGENTRLYKVVGKAIAKIGERRIGVRVDDKKWHKITVMVDGNKIYANVDGYVIFDGFTDDDPAMRRGKIGLSGHEYGWVVHYDNVLVLELNDVAKEFYQKTLIQKQDLR